MENEMGELKNYEDPQKNDLKYADSDKSVGNVSPKNMGEKLVSGMTDFTSPAVLRRQKRKFPLVFDIIIGILMLALAVGVVVGAYYLFRAFSDDYEAVEIEYTFVMTGESYELVRYRISENSRVYVDTENNTHYMGKVLSSQVVELDEEGNAMLVLRIASEAKYRKEEGYFIGDLRIAVGSDYILRSGALLIDGAIVELNDQQAVQTEAGVAEIDDAESESVSNRGGEE